MTPQNLDVSVVTPVKNEQESLPVLVRRIKSVLDAHHLSFELILVDDGSDDDSWVTIQELCAIHDELRALRFRRNFGKATALRSAFAEARGQVVVTMDADLQDDPDELPRFVEAVRAGSDVVSGWKRERKDPLSKTLPSKVFNQVLRSVSGLRLHDFNCGFKAYSAAAARALSPHVYGEMHRYLPVLAAAQGYSVSELEVRHHPRRFGKSKYGPGRVLAGAMDLLTVILLTRFRERPLHVFGLMATLSGLIALAATVPFLVTDSPTGVAVVGLLGMIAVVGLVGTGLVCELVVSGQGPADVSTRTVEAIRPSTRLASVPMPELAEDDATAIDTRLLVADGADKQRFA
jgi:glycosyltransferase involved in cell wall biosynthesis